MKTVSSRIFTVLFALVMLGVIFGILTNSRNSILIKEMIYVAGASVASLFAGFFFFSGSECFCKRIPSGLLVSLAAVVVYGYTRHYTGIESVNGPFTMLMLLSLSILAVAGSFFIDSKGISFLTGLLVVSSTLLFIYSVMQWQGLNLFPWDAALTRSGRSTGSLGNPNLLGGFASAVVPLGVSLLVGMGRGSTFVRRLLASLFAFLAVLAVIASGTRGSLIGLSAGCGFLAVWYIRSKKLPLKKTLPVVFVFLVIAGAAAIPMSGRLAELDPEAREQGTLQVRKLIWSGAYSVFLQNPLFGHGPGSFQILYPEHRNPDYSILGVSHNTLHTHCEYLEILVDLGVIGIILWGFVLFFSLKKFSNASPVRMGAFAGIAGMLAEAMVSVHLRWPPTAWLLSFLFLVFIASETRRSSPGRMRIPAGVLFTLLSVFLMFGFFNHYLPSARSSQSVFMGKDIYLNKTESAMQNAYSASTNWMNTGSEAALSSALNSWHYARMYADSSVFFSQRGTQEYPFDLGSWYALGSAHLTRYLIMDSPVVSMRQALEVSGVPVEFTVNEARDELLRGMAAYDSLLTMAPNYAEVHNNLALGYTNLGDLDKALEELYRAYLLHGHRRGDYHSQAMNLLPLCPTSLYGRMLVFQDLVLEQKDTEDISKYDAMLELMENKLSVMFADESVNGDSLGFRLAAIARSELSGEHLDAVLSLVEAAGSSKLYDWLLSEEYTSSTPMERLDTYTVELRKLSFASRGFPGVLPCERDFYTIPFYLFRETGFSGEAFQTVMEAFLSQVFIDQYLDSAFTLARSARFGGSADQEYIQHIDHIRAASGGSRTALRNSTPYPWVQGSLPSLLTDALVSLQEEDSLNSAWFEMELEMDFLLITSYWWDQQIFAQYQNQYLLDRIFRSRDRIRDVHPESWQSRVALITGRTFERVRFYTGGIYASPLELLKTDLINGADRSAAAVSGGT